MSDPIKLPHPLPGTRVSFQKRATFQVAAVVDVSWPEGVPFDYATAERMARNSIMQCREVNAAKAGIRWALVEACDVDVTHCETVDMTEERQ
jgi:hypothetical protein